MMRCTGCSLLVSKLATGMGTNKVRQENASECCFSSEALECIQSCKPELAHAPGFETSYPSASALAAKKALKGTILCCSFCVSFRRVTIPVSGVQALSLEDVREQTTIINHSSLSAFCPPPLPRLTGRPQDRECRYL